MQLTPDGQEMGKSVSKPTGEAVLAATHGCAPDPRIAWHLRNTPGVSELSVKLALAVGERAGHHASHEWEAMNAQRIESVLRAHNDKITDSRRG